jgi:replicative DNA helicase
MEAKKYLDGYGNPLDIGEAMQDRGHALNCLYLLEGTPRLTVSQVKAKALRAMAETGSHRCLIIVDYLQKWAAARREFTDFRHVVSGLLGELRELAMRLKVPVIAVSSQNRIEQGRAKMTSLKESGDLEYSADSIIFLTEPQEKRHVSPPMRAIDLTLKKNRYGDIGKIDLLFNPRYGHMREAEK